MLRSFRPMRDETPGFLRTVISTAGPFFFGGGTIAGKQASTKLWRKGEISFSTGIGCMGKVERR
jgi:hypothetical protein